MANKVPWYVLIDWKTIFWVAGIVIVIGGIGFFVTLPEKITDYRANQLKGSATGHILRIKENTALRNNYDGTKFVIDSYTVHYYFQIHGVTYNGTQNFQASSDIAKRFQDIARNMNQTVKIKYDPDNPRKSILLLKEKTHPNNGEHP